MKQNSKIALLLFVCFHFYSCNFFKETDNREAIARVYDTFLYKEDIAKLLKEDMSKQDSAMVVSSYINNWATQQLLVNGAKRNLQETDQEAFNNLALEYKNDLYSQAYMEALVAKNIDTLVSLKEAETYFNENKQIFKLNEDLIKQFGFTKDVVSGIRNIRKEKNISFKEKIGFSVLNNEKSSNLFDDVILKLGNLEGIETVDEAVQGALTFRVKSNEYFIPISGAVNVEDEIKKLTEELNYTEGFLISVQKKLSNERFVSNAPEQVVASEKQKEADAIAKIETLKASLASLG